MDPLTLAILGLRAIGTLFTLQGKPEVQTTINSLLAAYEVGKNVDNYMQEIADTLNAGGDMVTWENLTIRINNEVDEFLGDGSVPT